MFELSPKKKFSREEKATILELCPDAKFSGLAVVE